VTQVITQRELRNSSAKVMDAVERGETLIVTRNGMPVAELRPIRRRTFVSTAEVKRLFSGVPPADHAAIRAEMDALLGDDRIQVDDERG
jgi:prevent-host-death family protein